MCIRDSFHATPLMTLTESLRPRTPSQYKHLSPSVFVCISKPFRFLLMNPSPDRTIRVLPSAHVNTALNKMFVNGLRTRGSFVIKSCHVRAAFYRPVQGRPRFLSRRLGAYERHVCRDAADTRHVGICLLYTSDAADDLTRVDLGG